MEFASSFIAAFGFVALAELGDKTQLIAMCFAAKYKAAKVVTGVFIAILINLSLAVAAGYYLSKFLSAYTDYIQMAASISFIGFGLWTLHGESAGDVCNRKSMYGPVLTVAMAFFFAEMGDKTQLATMALAARLPSPFAVLAGGTAAMLVADTIGIVSGVIINKKMPEKIIKWISASIFTIVGIAGYVETGIRLLGLPLAVATAVLIAVAVSIMAFTMIKKKR